MQEAVAIALGPVPAAPEAARALARDWLVAQVGALGGAWEVETLDGPVVGARAIQNEGANGLAAELLVGDHGWQLWVTTFDAARPSARAWLVMAGWHVAAFGAAALVWRVAPLSFQLAAPLAAITFVVTLLFAAALVPPVPQGGRGAERAARRLLAAAEAERPAA